MKETVISSWRYVAPFAAWFACLMILPPTATSYAFRTVLTAFVGLMAVFTRRARKSTPVSSESGFRISSVFLGIAAGILVALLWIAPEYVPFYAKWCVAPYGKILPPSVSPYEPSVCGWSLTVVKLIGSAFVIAPAEEYFFRNFLYRRLQARDFLSAPLTRFDAPAFLWMILLFTLEHDRPLAAAIAGAVYGLVAIGKGMCTAVTAHITTNLLLGLYVIFTRAWAFW